MTQRTPALAHLAAAYGIATEFWDWQGRHTEVPDETVVAVLAALGVDVSGDFADRELDRAQEREWRRTLPPVLVIAGGESATLPMHVAPGDDVSAQLVTEEGAEHQLAVGGGKPEEREVDGVTVRRLLLEVPSDLPLGWHEVVVQAGGQGARMPLVVTPPRLGLPPGLAAEGAQGWGLMTQLYAMRSSSSWGIGDLADLGDAGAWAAGLGADFVLVNPLHAAEPVGEMEPSPYLPTSRRFVNPIYLRVEDVPEVGYLSAAQRQLLEWHADDAQRYLDLDTLERDPVWAAKEAALRLVHAQPRSLRRARAFEAYVEREGQGLVDFATWCAISQEHGTWWREWPQELQDARGEAVEAYRQEHEAEVDFHCWLQWVLDEQLARVQRDLLDTGMSLGVISDLAVGVHPDGADAWGLGDALARGVTVGAPADQYNQLGQDWSQPPWRPDKLAELGYAPYREMVRAALRDSGGLRVDHVIGLFRLWWIPEGAEPFQGTYVRYDHEAMIGILLLEAHRAGAVVIGEDLGTVEPWVRDYLRERGVMGTSILWFERDWEGDGRLLDPEDYRELCLATVTTHDLPPTAGYLEGVHVDLRSRLGLLDRPLEEEMAEEARSRDEVLTDLRRRGLLGEDADVTEQVQALHAFLTRTPAKLLGVSVSDLTGDTRVINQPGTDEEYPNWRVPLAGPDGKPVLLEEWVTWRSARRLARTVDTSGQDEGQPLPDAAEGARTKRTD
ncbi:4-alpha-glucanotransferase (amylomaltase) [Serinicoccus hydrothermalis]|uniref:4-alpha-glucanotransferase n=1 Tax=Serinicoccus hydrothermalis TaxID=1758689 RepID=A0A1B1NAR4_9MICO|nr:4-alpha-glucanotransferase [Serinicoccus hydrothermalis]ANS78522.1 4-alpha-glucanotransferase (amylomaltase) [Serinicoccus hydrothermalis]